MMAWSLGRRASNSSATRGRPPVMSRVLALSRRDTSKHVAGHHLMARLDRQDRIDRQEVASLAAARQLEHLALLVLDHHRRPEIGAARRGTPVDDHAVGRYRSSSSRRSLTDTPSTRSSKSTVPSISCEHRPGIGIPLGQTVAAFDLGRRRRPANACRKADDAPHARCRPHRARPPRCCGP